MRNKIETLSFRQGFASLILAENIDSIYRKTLLVEYRSYNKECPYTVIAHDSNGVLLFNSPSLVFDDVIDLVSSNIGMDAVVC